MSESRKLLKEYVNSRSEPAFRELVERYVNLVHSVALRLAGGDTHLAEDVTQIVFADLAAMAAKLQEEVLLGGWLHQHTCFVTNRTLRTERRRRIRERQAAEMNSQQDHTEANLARIAPILDEAIGRLGTSDRTAIILRYFEHYDLRSVGEALGTTEDAAQKRLSRALEKLHVLLKHRGATLSAAALGTALATEAVTAAPAGLAGSVAAAALANAAAGGGITATLVKLMTTTKVKLGIIGVLAVAGVATPLVIQHQSQAKLREDDQALRQQVGQLAQVAAENERLSNLVGHAKNAEPPSGELLRLRGQAGVLRRELADTKQRLDQAASQTNEASNIWALGATKWLRDLKDAGMGSPQAAVETYWWAVASTNVEKVKQCMVFDRGLKGESVSQLFAEREARSGTGRLRARTVGGLRLYSVAASGDLTHLMAGNDRATIVVEMMESVLAADGTPKNQSGPPPTQRQPYELMKLDGEWKVIGHENQVKLSLDDPDSYAVAELLLNMPPEQFQQVKSLVLAPALQAYEELKAKRSK